MLIALKVLGACRLQVLQVDLLLQCFFFRFVAPLVGHLFQFLKLKTKRTNKNEASEMLFSSVSLNILLI